MPEPLDRGRRTRQLRNLVEPIAAAVFFVPEAHDAYIRLGFPPPQGAEDGIPLFDWGAYFVSRAACLGPVHGAVVAAAFGVFEPAWVAHEITQGWTRTDPATILAARQQSAETALARLLGGVPLGVDRATAALQRGLAAVSAAGKPVFAGLRALGWPGTPLGDLWRACDLYREHRGDAHVTSWTSYGLNGCEACLVNDLHQGLRLGSYVRTRGWSSPEVATAIAALRQRGWLDGEQFSPTGRAAREAMETITDTQQRPILAAIGEAFDELVALLTPWRNAIMAGHGYPGRAFVERQGERAKQADQQAQPGHTTWA
jgi:hypothetical protein